MNAKPLPLIIQLQLTLQEESTTTCGSFEKETEGERGGPISCFLACQCSFVLITPAAAAPAPPCLARLFFFRGPPCRRRRRSDRATGSIPDLSGSRGVTPASGFYRHSAQHNTTHTPTHTTYIHCRYRRRAALFLRSCTFTFLDLLQRKANEPRNQQMKTLEERSTVIVCKNSRVDWPKAKTKASLFTCLRSTQVNVS